MGMKEGKERGKDNSGAWDRLQGAGLNEVLWLSCQSQERMRPMTEGGDR